MIKNALRDLRIAAHGIDGHQRSASVLRAKRSSKTGMAVISFDFSSVASLSQNKLFACRKCRDKMQRRLARAGYRACDAMFSRQSQFEAEGRDAVLVAHAIKQSENRSGSILFIRMFNHRAPGTPW